MNENDLKGFNFVDKKFDSLTDENLLFTKRDVLILKRGMLGKLKTFMFTFDKQFHMGSKDAFILEFFQDQNVLGSVKKLSNGGEWISLGVKAKKVKVTDVNSTQLSVEMFDRLYEKQIVRENGSIKKCLDEFYEEVLISDELRKLLLLEESDNFEIYSDEERNEFLFRLFKHVCIGGSVCQFEDDVQPYIDVSKSIYKDLMRSNNKLVNSFAF